LEEGAAGTAVTTLRRTRGLSSSTRETFSLSFFLDGSASLPIGGGALSSGILSVFRITTQNPKMLRLFLQPDQSLPEIRSVGVTTHIDKKDVFPAFARRWARLHL
jgi:hypothetical protein